MFHIYGLIVGLAIVVGWRVAESIEPRVSKVAPWVILFGLLGARLYHVIDLWEYYGQNLWQIAAIWNGGLGIYGAIIGGGVGLWIGRGDMKILGAIVTGLPLAQAVGRWGNYFNDELWGRNHEPLFLYESILDLALFVYIQKFSLRVRVGIYLVGYGLIRLVLEPLKPGAWWVGYVISGILVVTGVVSLFFNKRWREL